MLLKVLSAIGAIAVVEAVIGNVFFLLEISNNDTRKVVNALYDEIGFPKKMKPLVFFNVARCGSLYLVCYVNNFIKSFKK